MKNKSAIFALSFLTIIFAAILVFSLSSVDPRTAKWMQMIGTSLAIFAFFWSFLSTILLSFRSLRRRQKSISVSLRQGCIFSILILIALYLQRFNLLSWWNIAILVTITVLIEMFFIGSNADEERVDSYKDFNKDLNQQ